MNLIEHNVVCEKYNNVSQSYCEWLSQNNMSKGTMELYPATLKKFGAFLKTYKFQMEYGNEPKNDVIVAWKQLLAEQQAQQNTIRTYLYVLRAFFDWAVENNLYTTSPILDNDIPESSIGKHKLLSENEINKLLLEKPKVRKRNSNIERDRAIVLLILQCGFKVNEVINLQYSDLDFANSLISIPIKNIKSRPCTTIMFSTIKQCLQEYLSINHSLDTTYVFGYYASGIYKPFTRQYIGKIIHNYTQTILSRDDINSEDLLWTNKNSPLLNDERQRVVIQSLNTLLGSLVTSKTTRKVTNQNSKPEQNSNSCENETIPILPQHEEFESHIDFSEQQIRHGKQLSFFDDNPHNVQSTTKYNFSILDKMSGYEFEDFVANIFQQMGYQADVNNRSYDWGVDIIVRNQFFSIGVQCKISNTELVDNNAVQEIVAGIKHYNLDKGMVVTNNFFHTSTQRLAKENNVIFWNRNDLYREIIKLNGGLK